MHNILSQKTNVCTVFENYQKNLIRQKFWGFGAKIQIVLDFARNVVKWKKGDFLSDFQTL